MASADISTALQQQVQQALQDGTRLDIRGGGSKTFLGRAAHGTPLNVGNHRGIVDYDPRELVVTARTGTPLAEVEATLAEAGQMLAFEPPHFGTTATLGGTIACSLSGPRRPYAGSARDFTLGCRLINGRGEMLRFGGQVMKNVAGYDLSRLMAGAYGTLGVMLDVSLKVLPKPASSITLVYECNAAAAIEKMSGLLAQPYPVDAACFHGELCHLRLSGSEKAVRHTRAQLGGEELASGMEFWRTLNEHELALFTAAPVLYRIMVKPATPPLPLAGKWLLDWGGAQRWLASNEPPEHIRAEVAKVGGHVTQFRGGNRNGEIFQPLSAPLLALQQRLKCSLDPQGIFNPGRMYAEI
ncbi:MAG: glycolate oxidase subunit GlcE [Sideroxydans sp.]|nr:glycolate oxidase subunit GlcE [Sideroxydans sp.]